MNGAYVIEAGHALAIGRLHLDKVGAHLSELTPKQADYMGCAVGGPFKRDDYRY